MRSSSFPAGLFRSTQADQYRLFCLSLMHFRFCYNWKTLFFFVQIFYISKCRIENPWKTKFTKILVDPKMKIDWADWLNTGDWLNRLAGKIH